MSRPSVWYVVEILKRAGDDGMNDGQIRSSLIKLTSRDGSRFGTPEDRVTRYLIPLPRHPALLPVAARCYGLTLPRSTSSIRIGCLHSTEAVRYSTNALVLLHAVVTLQPLERLEELFNSRPRALWKTQLAHHTPRQSTAPECIVQTGNSVGELRRG